MRWAAPLVFLVLVGCSRPQTLAGDWTGRNADGSEYAFILGEDGTFLLLSRSASVGPVMGNYRQQDNRLILEPKDISMATGPQMNYTVAWTGVDAVTLKGKRSSMELVRTGPARETASAEMPTNQTAPPDNSVAGQ